MTDLRPRSRARHAVSGLALLGVLLPLCGCASEPVGGSSVPVTTPAGPQVLTVYSGRPKALVGELLDRMGEELGVKLEVRYGGNDPLAQQLAAEGPGSPADLFLSQDAGALGQLENRDMLADVPDDARQTVPGAYRSASGKWVGVTARARVVLYDQRQVRQHELPKGVDDLLLPRWRGKIGYAPANASWHSFVTALRVLRGEEAARTWLTRFRANNPRRYDTNSAIRDAVDAGKIALGLANHYYWYEKAAEVGAAKLNVRVHHITGNDPAALVNVTAVGIPRGADTELGARAVRYLLSAGAQQYFADHLAEYPLLVGVSSTKHQLPPLASIKGPDLNLNRLASVQESLDLLTQTGLR
ncbi:iron(III) transport system substrate-binding protein [Crossiella equi]|uniref:Iron(III) transport system substrate-binding protein n=1 Tax=Crossiella equi TaxID=130796 RepID=A0ABS5AHA4_9PSEU|nr:extracellular solute-binding protein [Crossiella equi]MBP2475667.1 iron(III) transport system substrate-binding protein [Crossiella equi]